MLVRQTRLISVLLTGVAALLLIAACGPTAPPPIPTRTPAPTFTPTPEGQVVSEALAVDPNTQPAEVPIVNIEESVPAEGENSTGESVEVVAAPAEGESVEAVAAPVEEPTPEPTTAPPAEVVIDNNMNIRGGPGTNYNILGGANQGERYPVTGRNDDGSWWQIDYNGQSGWVFGELVSAANVETVAVAQNIPAPPAPTPVPPTPVPPPAEPAPAEPAPAEPQPAQSNYKFNITAVSKCAPQEAGTWFEGRTYVNGQPQNGHLVVFSYAPDGPPITEPMISGPHQGYEGWNTGYYSHIISAAGPREGNWFVWIVDSNGNRISEIANWQSKGRGGDCNQAAVDFDSRP